MQERRLFFLISFVDTSRRKISCMNDPDEFSLSGLRTRGDTTSGRGTLPPVTPVLGAGSVPDSTFSGQSTHSGSTSFADLQAAADDLDEVEFEFVDLSRHYEMQGELGQGGMGVVYRAFDRQLQRPVAIKRLKPDLVANRRALARFQSEALAVASLRHENIVQIYRLGRDAVGPFLVLELVEGESLATRLTRGKLELDEAIRMFLALAGGISLSHRHGIIHRDIKPGNILLTLEGVPKLSDFGIARRSSDSGLTSTAAAMGTLYYMAPEQHRDARAVTEQSDLYSLAATFYHAVTGEPPQVIREQRLPESVRELTLKALERDPAHRHPSVAEFAADLRAAQMQLAAPTVTVSTDSTTQEGECPACHVTNPLNRKFCKGCGEPLTEPCPQCEQPSLVWERFCADCGTDIPEKWVAIGQDLVEKSQQIEALSREQRYAEALALVRPIELLSSPRWQEWKTWATDTAATLQTSLMEQQQQHDTLFAEAKAAFQAARYEDAVSLLDQIHTSQSTPEIESLRSEAITRSEELDRLIQDIKAQVASKDYAGLRRNVDRVLELSAGDRRVMKLDEQLSKREEKEREREVQRLEQERLLEEQQREARRSKQLRLWSSGKQTGERRVFTVKGIEYAFRWCPPGKFTMGSPKNEAGRFDDEAQVQVELTKGFWMQETVVTQAMWSAVMGSQPWRGQTLVKEGPNCLATYVDWNRATEFCHRLTAAAQQSGDLPAGEIALPTEVRWEYACRAGTTTAYSFGSEPAKLGDYAWFSDNTSIERYAHEVGQKKPNPWGLLDMHGNVWEWCQDGYDAKLRGGRDPVVSSGASRVLRGGSWNSDAIYARCSSRYNSDPAFRNSRLGFRVLLELQDQHAAVNAASLRGLVEFGSPVAIGELRHPNAH